MAVLLVIVAKIIDIQEQNGDFFAISESIDAPFAKLVAPR
jgi:hypothetical protein